MQSQVRAHLNTRFVRNSAFGTIAAVSNTAGNFLSGLIVARVLGVEGVGTYSFAVWIVAVATTITGAGLPFTMTRYLPEFAVVDGEQKARGLAAFLLRPVFAFNMLPIAIAIACILWFSRGDAGEGILRDPLLCLLIGLSCAAQGLGDFAKAYLRGMHAMDRVARISSIAMFVQLVLIILGSLQFGVQGAMFGYLIGAALPIIPIRDFWRDKPDSTPETTRRLFKYAKYRWASEIGASFVFSRIEIFFLHAFWGAQSVGYLAASLTLANLAIQGPLMLTWGLLPHFSEQFGQKDMDGLRKAYASGTRIMGFLILPACFGLAAIVPVLLPLLFGQAFSDAVPSAVVLVAAASVSATATVGANLIWAMERSDVDFYLGIVGAVLSVGGGLLLIAPFGLMGAAYSRAITQCVVIGLGTWFLWRRLGFDVPFNALARLLLAALLCAGAARLCLIVMPTPLGVVVAIAVGAVTYLAAVRVVGGLEADDIAKIRSLADHLPVPAGAIAHRLVHYALG